MLTALQGYKTYIIGVLAIVYAWAAFFWGASSGGLIPPITQQQAIQLTFLALASMGLRGGIATEIRLVLSALGVQLPPNASMGAVKAAVANLQAGVKKAAPILFVACIIGLASMTLGACSTVAGTALSSFQNDLDVADAGIGALYAAYEGLCAADASASFCTPAAQAEAKTLEAGIAASINTAQGLINISSGAASGTMPSSTQISAAIQSVTSAVAQFESFVSGMQSKAAAKGIVAPTLKAAHARAF